MAYEIRISLEGPESEFIPFARAPKQWAGAKEIARPVRAILSRSVSKAPSPRQALAPVIGLGSRVAFGPDNARLLEAIGETGSLHAAAARLKISRSTARDRLRATEDLLQARLVRLARSGARGGGSVLTDLGREVVTAYRAFEKKSTRAAAKELRVLERALIRG